MSFRKSDRKTRTWDPRGTPAGPHKNRRTGMWSECGVWVDCKCMEFVAAGCCTKGWLRFDQTIRNFTSGDLGIPLVVSRRGVTGLKKTRVVYLLDLLERRGENGQCDLVHAKRLQMIRLMVIMLTSCSHVVSVVLVLWEVAAILRNEYGI